MARSRSTPTKKSTERGRPVPYKLNFTSEAEEQYRQLEHQPSLSKRLKAVRKTLGLMETNLRHPSLNTHKYDSLEGPNGEEAFEAYAQQRTPSAYRVFWCYGPKRGEITIIAITPHP